MESFSLTYSRLKEGTFDISTGHVFRYCIEQREYHVTRHREMDRKEEGKNRREPTKNI